MASVNKVLLLGNLTKAPECRTMQSGGKVANFTIATNQSWKDKETGERKEKAEFHRVVIFGPLADIAERYLEKGSKVYVQGALQTRKWTDKDGVERYTTEVVLQGFHAELVMLDGKGKDTGDREEPEEYEGATKSAAPAGAKYGSHRSGASQPVPNDDFTDEIPF